MLSFSMKCCSANLHAKFITDLPSFCYKLRINLTCSYLYFLKNDSYVLSNSADNEKI